MKTNLLALFALVFAFVTPVFAAPESGGTAGAGGGQVDVFLTVKPADLKDPKQAGNAPEIEATIVGGQKTTVDKMSISTTNAQNQRVTIKASKIKNYVDGTEPIAIALVVCGQEIWIGNEDVETDPSASYPGVLKNLEAAIDKLGLGTLGPPGSKGVVVSYSTGADTKFPMSDLKLLTGGVLGSQKDYRGKIGTDMVNGISAAIAELSKVSTPRKALIVVGDGNDTNNEAAKGQLVDLKKQANAQKIQMFAIIYKSSVSSEGSVITNLIGTAKTVNSIEGIQNELNNIIARMADRYYLTFPGFDKALGLGLPWDGKEHDMVIKIDQQDLEPASLQLAPAWAPPVNSGFPWLAVILTIVGLILLFVIIKALTRKKAEPLPAPMPMMQMAPEAPKPMGPSKTVMMNSGGSEEGFPIVGWLVPLNGVSAYQTWRLKPGLTKIGTAPPSDIVVNDGFMSTEHCSITSSPAGFTLHDGGSTNGCYVNDRKVAKHDLLDNDVIMLGKTNFKFKSIN